jgi:peptidyl-prolyl cis-trans isomerase B (cyclophilin B)
LEKIIFTLIFTLFLISFGNFADGTEIYGDDVVVLETSVGNIVIEFFSFDAPYHVQNFIILTESGFYDGTLFHRIIPGFMIQGGDPNTVNGDQNTWGQGGPDERLDAEFNSIKHNRGIVSMARSADPNSAGSQFFIIHKDSNFLDGEYTVFGRIASEESFRTLDKIAAVQTGTNDRPIDLEKVKIIKAKIVNRYDISDYLNLPEPERTSKITTDVSSNNQIFESKDLNVSFSAPQGWLLQQTNKQTNENVDAPDAVAVGPKIDGINPVISLTIRDAIDKTIDDLVEEKNNILEEAIYLNKLEVLSQTKTKTNVVQTSAIGNFESDGDLFKVKFLDVMILSEGKSYNFAYSNSIDNFDNELENFKDTLNSFKILSQDSTIIKSTEEEGGGCLIATAAYGSEMAPQVQQLRELRDNKLLNTESGTAFMGIFNDIYYSFSPIIADYERENPLFKEAVKLAITPMISTLSLMENAESESEILGLGLSVIALNLGMYFGAPAIVIIGIRKKF